MSVLSLIRRVALALLVAAVYPALSTAQGEDQGEDQSEETTRAPGHGASGLPVPRFVSLRAPKVNLRTGPGVRYPIEWVYSRAGLPLEVIDEFETWRQVRDWEGSVGWIHQSMLSGARKVMVRDKQRLLRREPDPASLGVALLAPGVIGDLRRCAGDWCQIEVGDKSGWLRRIDVYGLYPGETIR